MGLMNVAKAEVAKKTKYMLENLFAENKEILDALILDYEKGTVILEDQTFTYAGKSLRIILPCPVCGVDTPSQPIRCVGDVADQIEHFKAMRHDCMDV